MSSYKIVGRRSDGYSTAYLDTDVAQTPQTIQANTGQLTIQSQTATPVIPGTGLRIPAGQLLDTATTGNINLPNNGSAQFQIAGTSVGSTVIATNLNTLTNGGDASALHTHVTTPQNGLPMSFTSIWSTPVVGEIGYVSGNGTASKALATVLTTSRGVGVYTGTANTLSSLDGKQSMLFEAGLGTITGGSRVWESATTAGRVTTVEPQNPNFSFEIGILLDGSTYITGAGSACPVICRPGVIFAQ